MRAIILLGCIAVVAFSCVNRADVIAKAMEWVSEHVPYSQSEFHEGYRTECAGFVSCAWKLSKPGITTEQFIHNKVCVKTTKDNLERGDLILAPGNHVAIF